MDIIDCRMVPCPKYTPSVDESSNGILKTKRTVEYIEGCGKRFYHIITILEDLDQGHETDILKLED